MTSTREQRRAAFLALPRPTVARYLAAGGAHIIVSGIAKDMTLAVSCEACGNIGGPYLTGELASAAYVTGAALRDAQNHAERCRRIPERLWPENAEGAK